MSDSDGDRRSVEDRLRERAPIDERADAIKADIRRVKAEAAAAPRRAPRRSPPSDVPETVSPRRRRKKPKPQLVNQPTAAPTRKLKYGGIAAVLAIVLTVILKRALGVNLPPELASLMSSEILMALGAAVVWGVGYFVRSRKSDC